MHGAISAHIQYDHDDMDVGGGGVDDGGEDGINKNKLVNLKRRIKAGC